jgi:hypothetical protein|tara:strand:- start:244 stop:624 length:381 start_codon:yes stop_codon:yes gene_type:complete
MKYDKNGLLTIDDVVVKTDSNGKQRSDAWVGRFDVNCSGDMLELEKFKDTVKYMNKLLKESGVVNRLGDPVRYRVECKGRKPVEKRINPRTGNEYGYKRFGDIVGGISNAGMIDAYIYTRPTRSAS